MSVRIRPLHDRIIVRRDKSLAETAGGIALPLGYQERPRRGTVVSVGSGHHNKDGDTVPLVLKDGDRVVFGQYAGTEIEVNGEKLTIMRESDCVAVIEGDETGLQTATDSRKREAGEIHPYYAA